MSIGKMGKKVGYIWAALLVAVVAGSGWSSANNFKAATDKTGCASIVGDSEREACKKAQDAKNTICNVKTECEPDKQERLISDYKDALKKLEEGKINASDVDSFKRSIRDMKDKLDARKAAAVAGQKVASACIKARDAVQEWFERVGIPFTERARDAALAERKVLLEKLQAAERKKNDAKTKEDRDKAVDEMQAVQKELEAFNSKYGHDVEYNANKLIRHYQSEKTNHDTPSKQAEDRLNNCKKVEGLSYPSLPF
jgi:hypothetical protein